jgi:hypothetical protein
VECEIARRNEWKGDEILCDLERDMSQLGSKKAAKKYTADN